MKILNVKTKGYLDQKIGTSGLRKKVEQFQQKNYLENFIESICKIMQVKNKRIVIGGDGRFFNKEAIIQTLKILIAHEVSIVYVGQNGLFSTPAISYFIKKNKLDYAIIFSASHNPAGEKKDFGIKVNDHNGYQISDAISEKIYCYSKNITSYKILNNLEIDLSKLDYIEIGKTIVEIVNPVKDYTNYMKEIFDFNKISDLIKSGFTMKYEAFHAVTGIYAKDIFVNNLGISKNDILHSSPLEDFGNMHANPNRVYAKHLIDINKQSDSPDILFAADGDGDRNLIIGKNHGVVSPSDSLAIIFKYAFLIPFYSGKITGVARSLPTSQAADLVAKKLNLNTFFVPTGWKFFANLLKYNKITFCGEESCGTGSNHSGEKDGIWSMLFWLNIIAETKKSVHQIVYELWKEYGRFYFVRLDYENINNDVYANIQKNIYCVNNYNNQILIKKKFHYTDPITNEVFNNKADIITTDDNTRIIIRESGTGTENKTIRFYIEKYDKYNIDKESTRYLKDLIDFITTYICDGKQPDIID